MKQGIQARWRIEICEYRIGPDVYIGADVSNNVTIIRFWWNLRKKDLTRLLLWLYNCRESEASDLGLAGNGKVDCFERVTEQPARGGHGSSK
jgi:hypothetical protein